MNGGRREEGKGEEIMHEVIGHQVMVSCTEKQPTQRVLRHTRNVE